MSSNQYEPWKALEISEIQYWKKQHIDQCKALMAQDDIIAVLKNALLQYEKEYIALEINGQPHKHFAAKDALDELREFRKKHEGYI